MSRHQSGRFGLALFSSSALTLAGVAASSLAVALTPSAALAYDECVPTPGSASLSDGAGGVSDPTLNGATADSFTCVGDKSSTGVTYTSDGSLTIVAVDVTVGDDGLQATGSGGDALVLNLSGVTGAAGNAVRTIGGGGVSIGISTDAVVAADGTSAVVDMVTSASEVTTLTNAGFVRSTATAQGSDTMAEDLALRGSGAGAVVIQNSGGITGRVDFSAQTGAVTFNITGSTLPANGWSQDDANRERGWFTGGTSTFTSADDTLSTSSTGIMSTSPGGLPDAPGGIVTTIDFGDGADTFGNAGALVAGVGRQCGLGNLCFPEETVTTLQNLETFNNSGMVLLGANLAGQAVTGAPLVFGDTDGQTNDTLVMHDTAFTGSGASRIGFDVDLSGVQTSCADRVADCVDIAGGSTAGATLVTINDIFPGKRGVYNPDGILLVDVAGGTSAAGHFTLDPNSDFYDARLGALNKGDFLYVLVYDEENQRHVLATTPGENMQFAPMAHAAQNIWYDSAATYFTRQADLRDAMSNDPAGGIWMRAGNTSAKRELAQTSSVFGASFTLDNTYKQDVLSISGGIDMITRAGRGGNFVVGLTLGYAQSDLDFEAWENRARFKGATGGIYASYVAGPLFLDGLVHATGLTMDSDIPDLGLFPASHELTTNLRSIGTQAEAGVRLNLFGSAYLEPVIGVSYVKTSFDDLKTPDGDFSLPGNVVEWEDSASLRGSIGARFSLLGDYGPVLMQYSASARLANEFDGEAAVVLGSSGPDAFVTDVFDGQFTELGLGLSAAVDNGVSGFLSAVARLNDDYRSVGMSAGIRYQW